MCTRMVRGWARARAVLWPTRPLLPNLEVPLGLPMPTDAQGCGGGKLLPLSLKRCDMWLCCINCCETDAFLFLLLLTSSQVNHSTL